MGRFARSATSRDESQSFRTSPTRARYEVGGPLMIRYLDSHGFEEQPSRHRRSVAVVDRKDPFDGFCADVELTTSISPRFISSCSDVDVQML
jgi:hypothetical protein